MFKSDFKYVADYFVQSRKKVDYVPAPGTIRHVHEVLQLLEALTGDQRFENAINIADTKGANTINCNHSCHLYIFFINDLSLFSIPGSILQKISHVLMMS